MDGATLDREIDAIDRHDAPELLRQPLGRKDDLR